MREMDRLKEIEKKLEVEQLQLNEKEQTLNQTLANQQSMLGSSKFSYDKSLMQTASPPRHLEQEFLNTQDVRRNLNLNQTHSVEKFTPLRDNATIQEYDKQSRSVERLKTDPQRDQSPSPSADQLITPASQAIQPRIDTHSSIYEEYSPIKPSYNNTIGSPLRRKEKPQPYELKERPVESQKAMY